MHVRVALASQRSSWYRVSVAANISQAVKQAMQDLVAPQLESLKGDIQTLRAEVQGDIHALRAEVQGNHAALTSEIRRVDDKLTWALDLRERIATIEAKLAAPRP